MYYVIPPDELQRLLLSEWDQPDGPIYVREDLTLREVRKAPLFHNARALLTALNEAGGTRATEAGNLNREFVRRVLGRLELRAVTADDYSYRPSGQVNEQDIMELHLTRVLLDQARLIRRYKGKFRLTERGRALLADDQAGALYALLFRTYFRTFNLAYLDHMPDVPGLQFTLAFSILRVAVTMEEWRDVNEVAESLLLPQVAEQFPRGGMWPLTPTLVYTRILRPLLHLGVLEERRAGGRFGGREMRKTDLFHRALQFDVRAEPAPRGLL